jgi:hypothetical protein
MVRAQLVRDDPALVERMTVRAATGSVLGEKRIGEERGADRDAPRIEIQRAGDRLDRIFGRGDPALGDPARVGRLAGPHRLRAGGRGDREQEAENHAS